MNIFTNIHIILNEIFAENSYIFISILLAVITIGYDILSSLNENRKIVKSSIKVKELLPIQLGAVLLPKKGGGKKAIIAEIIEMAVKGKFKFTVQHNSSLDKNDLYIKIINKNGLSEIQQKIINKLEKDNSLRMFLKDDGFFQKISREIVRDLSDKEIFSRANIQIRKRLVIFGILFFFIPAFFLGLYGLWTGGPIVIAITIFLTITGLGRLIKIPVIPYLSKEGKDLESKVENFINEKKVNFETGLKVHDEIDSDFYEDFPYIVLHPKIKKTKLKKYRKSLMKKNNLLLPGWFELEDSIQKNKKNNPLYILIEIIKEYL